MRFNREVARRFFILILLIGIGPAMVGCVRPVSTAALFGARATETPQPPAEQTGPDARKEPAAEGEPAGNTESEAQPEPAGQLQPADWGDPPDCSIQPLSAAALSGAQADPGNLQRAASLAHADDTGELLAGGEAENALAGLALNVASGRLNRATELELPDLPDVQTVGDLLEQLEAGVEAGDSSAALIQAGQQVQAGQGIARAVCARLLVTQLSSQPGQVEWSEAGVQAVTASETKLGPPETRAARRLVMDTGQVSPDGKRAAFTSLGYESGGPVFLQDLESGVWTNLIEEMNAQVAEDQPPLAGDLWWEVIGWFPDSSQLMIGPAELSSVFVVDLDSYAFKVIPFPGGGLGGGAYVQLAPDGSYFVFVTYAADGGQALTKFDLSSGQMSPLVQAPAGDGLLLYPRFAPDGASIAYLMQKGDLTTGMTYAIDLLSIQSGASQTLVEGSLGPTVPTWSPDGQKIAFTRKESDEPDRLIPEDQASPPMRGNVWVVPAAGGAAQQVTAVDGWARSPAWDYDSQTLAFITQDGLVGLVDVSQPGQMWLAAETSTESPLFTSAFFVP